MLEVFESVKRAAEEAHSHGIPFVVTYGKQGAPARDRQWFNANPKRAYRLRPVAPDEVAPADCSFVIVSRLSKGARSRVFTCMPGVEAALDADDRLLALIRAESNRPTGCSVATLAAMCSFQKGGMQ